MAQQFCSLNHGADKPLKGTQRPQQLQCKISGKLLIPFVIVMAQKKMTIIKTYFQIIFTEVFHHQYPALSNKICIDKYAYILQNKLLLNFYL